MFQVGKQGGQWVTISLTKLRVTQKIFFWVASFLALSGGVELGRE